MPKTEAFDNHLAEYEQWFVENRFVFLSEAEAVRSVMPASGRGIEIGAGSGIFAAELGIREGCDPSAVMREKSIQRGIDMRECRAEDLPYENASFDFVLMTTAICFVDNVDQTLKEIYRVLKNTGRVILAFVDKDSPLGKIYLKNKEKSIFYKEATFYSTDEIYALLSSNRFTIEKTCQTVFGGLADIKEIQSPEEGHGTGGFVVIRAAKK